MPINIDLHIVATSVEDLKKQLKDAYESLEPVAPPVVEPTPLATPTPAAKTTPVVKPKPVVKAPVVKDAPKKLSCKACNGAHRAHTCHRSKEQRATNFAKAELIMKCSDCGTHESSQWRNKTASFGPLCNACGIRRIRNKPPVANPRSQTERKKERALAIQKNIMRKAPAKAKTVPKTVEKKPQPIVKVDLSDETFGAWLTTHLGPLVLRNKQFLVASTVIKNWYTTLMSEESYGPWVIADGDSNMVMMETAFNAFQMAQPTTFLVQNTGDNFLLVITNPKALTTKLVREIDLGLGV